MNQKKKAPTWIFGQCALWHLPEPQYFDLKVVLYDGALERACVCLFVCLYRSNQSMWPVPSFLYIGPCYMGPSYTITPSACLLGARVPMSCVRIENTVLYPCPALICPLEFNHASNIILRKRRLWVYQSPVKILRWRWSQTWQWYTNVSTFK